jgi:RND family efflux transporter MFP subunit
MTALRIAAVAAVLFLGCGTGTEPAVSSARSERPAESITHYGSRTELYVEFPALVAGLDSPFAAHLTTLADFKPLTAGRVSVVLIGQHAAEERFEALTPTVPGIFRPVARPAAPGERRLVVEITTDDGVERHELGTVSVVGDTAHLAQPAEAAAPRIAFLKEQQWRTDFATAAVGARVLRPALGANGTITARADGEAYVVAPFPGRLVARESVFPRLGMQVRRDQVLAAIAPRLGADVDVASLELALQQASIASDHARRERRRLEGLLAEQAVPERRVIEARHEEASADAAVTAAQRRLEQFRGTQRAAASDRSSVVELRSPIDGTVVAVDAAPGAFVEEGRNLFRVVDLGRIWLQAQIPESDVSRVQGASGAWFTVDGFADPFEVDAQRGGRLVALGGVVDPHTRTVPLVFEFDNPDSALRVGMFARVHVLTGAPVEGLAMPLTAVIDDGGQYVAYVQASGEAFERRPLRLGIRDGDWVQVLDGLTPGERVVTRGAYQVRLAAAASTLPAHGHVH